MAVKQTSATPDAIDRFRALVRNAPALGIGQLSATFRLMENIHFEYNDYIRNLAGGAPEGITWGLYNVIGEAYPSLTRGQKDLAISQTLAIMDEQDYSIVNGLEGVGHTTGIREPLYLGEIATARRLYWPGLDEGRLIIKRHNGDFKEIRADLITEEGTFRQDKVHSDFLVAYAFLRTDFSNFGENFVKVFDKAFIDRTVTAIAKMRVSNAKTGEERAKGFDRLRVLLPRSLHDRIEPASEMEDWVDPEQFP